MKIIDAYAHVARERFLSPEQLLGTMDANDIHSAVACTTNACPHLDELHRALHEHPHRLRCLGLPIGQSPEEMLRSVEAQMTAGFAGLRVADHLVATYPELIEPVGRVGGVVVVVGAEGLMTAAGLLCDLLERHEDARVCGAQFAGPTRVEIFERIPSVRRLFRHERFGVICSGQTLFEPHLLYNWMRKLVKVVGWERLMYGSEQPVNLWRNETCASTLGWFEQLKLNPHRKHKRAFFYANAKRVFFHVEPAAPKELPEEFMHGTPSRRGPVEILPSGSLHLREEDLRRIMRRYLDWGGDARGPLSEFLGYMLTGYAKRLENEKARHDDR